jgi:hypothetical protein
VQLGPFEVEWFRVTHSIPDAAGLGIRTPLGLVVHTGDFKIDHTPVDGKAMDLNRIAQLGQEGVVLLCSDSTYSERAGYTPSEQVVADNIDRIIGEAEGRVIVASFASLISRIQIVLDAAAKYGRRVFVFGRSMVDNVEMAVKMGYLRLEPGILGSVEELRRAPPAQTIICDGLVGTTSAGASSATTTARSASRATPSSFRPAPSRETTVSSPPSTSVPEEGASIVGWPKCMGGVKGNKVIMASRGPGNLFPASTGIWSTHAGPPEHGPEPERTFVPRDGDVLLSGRALAVEKIPASYVCRWFRGIGDEGRTGSICRAMGPRRHYLFDG